MQHETVQMAHGAGGRLSQALMQRVAVTLGAGGAALWRRIVAATVSGAAIGIFATVAAAILDHSATASKLITLCAMHTFASAVLATIAAIVTEMMLPDPDLKSMGV